VIWILLFLIWITMLIVQPERTAIGTIVLVALILVGKLAWSWYGERDGGGL